MARVSAVEAAQRMASYMKDKTGKNRRVPPINMSIQQMIRENTVHVFNVGPWGYRESMGSFGFFFIPACEVGAPMEWKRVKPPAAAPGVFVPDMWEEGDRHVADPRTEYAAMRPLPGLMVEPLPTEIDQCTWNMQDEGAGTSPMRFWVSVSVIPRRIRMCAVAVLWLPARFRPRRRFGRLVPS